MKFCSIQMKVKEADGDCNRKTAQSIMESYAGADFYLLPELWSSGYCQDEWLNIAKNDSQLSIDFMAKNAREQNAWLGGSIIYLDELNKLRNRFMLFDRKGFLVGYYDKAHLFPLMREEKYLEPGKMPPVFDVEGFNIAPTICYDLRFPEMYRRLLLKGVDIFLVSAEWPTARQDIMTTLVQARAIESQSYLILSNRVGLDRKNESFAGNSMIVGPSGIIKSAGDTENTAIEYCLYQSDIISIRELLPTLNHRLVGVDYD